MNKIYLIMGASSDVGTAYIEYLHSLGEPVIVLAQYRNNNPEFDRVCNIESEITIEPLQADLLNENDVTGMLEEIKRKYGTPTHILHLPAAKLEYCKIKNMNWDNIKADFMIQTETLGRIFQMFLPQMAKKRYGKVAVMLSSVTLGAPPKFMTAYVINKYALLGLMKSAAMEYAEKGININGISPNMMETKFLSNIDARLVEMTANASVMQRNAEVREIIPTIHYLLSEGSDYMNGVNINLSGGDK